MRHGFKKRTLNKKAGAIHNAPAFSYRIVPPFERLLPGEKMAKTLIFDGCGEQGNHESY